MITEPKHEQPVHLGWQGVEREGTTLALRDGRLTMVARNDLAEPVELRVGVRLVEGPATTHRDLGAVAVPARGSAAVEVDVTDFGIDYRRLAAPANIVGLGRVSVTDGRIIARQHTGTLFLAADPRADAGSVVAYDDTAMRERLASRTSPGATGGSQTLAIVDGREGLPDPELPLDGSTHRFCLKYQINTIDSGFGEDIKPGGDAWLLGNQLHFGVDLWTAHGVKYQLNEPGVGWGSVRYADIDTGCFSFSSAETAGFTIRVFGEARPYGNDILRVKRTTQTDVLDVSWDINANPGPGGGTRYYVVPAGPEASMLGIASSVVHRVKSLTGAVVANDHKKAPFSGKTLTLHYVPWDSFKSPCGADGGACYNPAVDTIYSEWSELKQKFVIAHEVGHWMHDNWSGSISDVPGYYSYDDVHAACAFDGVGEHAMRSREQATSAFTEGVAHFVAALAWNEPSEPDAVFKYYKVADDPGEELYDNDLIDVAADGPEPEGGIVNWNDNMCEAETSPHIGHSVEQDWLRFLWDYTTASGVRPTLNQVAHQIGVATADPGLTATNVAATFVTTLEGTPYQDRWVELAEVHGVESST